MTASPNPRSDAWQPLLAPILEQMGRLLALDVGLVWLLDGADLYLAAGRGLPEAGETAAYRRVIYPKILEVIAGNRPVVRRDLFAGVGRGGPDSRALLPDAWEKVRSCICAPVVWQDRPLGVLVAAARQRDRYAEATIQSVMAFANQIAMAIENTRLFLETRDQLDRMRALHDISVDICSHLEIQQVLNAIVRQAARLLNAEASTLAICEPERNTARVVALYNVPFEYEELVLRPGASAASHVLVTGKPVVINDLRLWAAAHGRVSRGAEGNHHLYDAILSVPLVWQERITGALTVLDHSGRRPFSEDDTRFLSLLANLAGVALNNAHLYSRLVQLNQQLECKVEERTRELAEAREELARKAEELQRFLGMTVLLQEEERARIARDLHDSSNQLITAILFEVQAAQQSIQMGRSRVALEKLQTVKELLRQIEAENRRLISDLRPPLLDTHGLVTALQRLVERWQSYSGVRCTFRISGSVGRLPDSIETTVYRILQEALNNVAAHARARSVEIHLDFQTPHLLVTVSDDGVGFDIAAAAAGDRTGLIGMRERAQSVGGHLEVRSRKGEGTRLLLKVPVAAPSGPSPSGSAYPQMSRSTGGAGGEEPRSAPAPAHPGPPGPTVSVPGGTEPEGRNHGLTARRRLSLIADAVADLREEETFALIHACLQDGLPALEILNEGVLAGLKAIGRKFETKYYFLDELLAGAKLAETCIDLLRPHLPQGSRPNRGVIVIGAVQGDIHSIGYQLVAQHLELAGYKVHRLGVNVPSMTFIEKAEEFKADIIALSAFLVTTISYCREVIKYLEDMGIREKYRVIIGGSETSQEIADAMGADGWAGDAVGAVRLCDSLLGHAQP